MNNILQKLKNPYILLGLGIGIFLVFFFFALISTQPVQPKNGQIPINQTAPGSSKTTNEILPKEDYYGDYGPSGLQGGQKVEDLAGGTKKYTSSSSNPARTNLIIAKDNRTIYQRSIPLKGADIPLQNFIGLFGQADKIIDGPDFYGIGVTSEYIYARIGIAIVVDNQSKQVVEQHFFKPTTVDEYIKNYGNDSFH